MRSLWPPVGCPDCSGGDGLRHHGSDVATGQGFHRPDRVSTSANTATCVREGELDGRRDAPGRCTMSVDSPHPISSQIPPAEVTYDHLIIPPHWRRPDESVPGAPNSLFPTADAPPAPAQPA